MRPVSCWWWKIEDDRGKKKNYNTQPPKYAKKRSSGYILPRITGFTNRNRNGNIAAKAAQVWIQENTTTTEGRKKKFNLDGGDYTRNGFQRVGRADR